MAIKTRLLVKHEAGCNALRYVADGTWGSPWILDSRGKPYVFRDAGGGRRSTGCSWLRFRCNTVSCPAILIAREDDIVALLPTGGQGKEGTRW